MEQKTIIKADEGSQVIEIKRAFDLPVELLFKAHEEPELLEQWMGTKVIKMECKKHGSYRFETAYGGKVVFSANGTIHDFVPNERITRTFEMENAGMGVQLEFLEFRPLSPGKSELTTQIIYRSPAHRAIQLKMPFAYGLNMAHDRLQDILSKLIK